MREKAEQKLRSEVGKLAPLKQRRPELVIAVAGCVAQQEGEKLLERDRPPRPRLGPDNLAELPALALAQRAGALPRRPHRVRPRRAALPGRRAGPPVVAAPVSAFVTTMKGCDERCSFCVVPYTRGPERYRPAAEIVGRGARAGSAAGAREVMLLGQTVDSYRDPSLPRPRVRRPATSRSSRALLIAAHRGRRGRRRGSRASATRARTRATRPPRSPRAHAELDVLARHVHLPVQSGSDRMLRRMIRRYTRAEYVARVTSAPRARARG